MRSWKKLLLVWLSAGKTVTLFLLTFLQAVSVAEAQTGQGTLTNGAAAGFRASVVKLDITPETSQWLCGYGPRQSTGVYDRLYHRIVAMDDGKTQFFLISTDIAEISPGFYDQVMRELEKQTGIKALQVWWTVTHTHSAPEVGPPGLDGVFMPERYQHESNTEYSARVEKELIEGIKQARVKLEPARLGVGWGFALANINRRARDVEGPAFLGLNPDGPADRRIGLLRLEKADGTLLALIANYAMHGTVLGPDNKLISGDAPGIVAAYVEEKLGVPMLYIQGAAGNMAPTYSGYPFERRHLSQFRVLLGDRILEANRQLGSTTSDVRLSLSMQTVETPLRKDSLAWPPELDDYLRKTSTGATVVRVPVRFLQINDDIAIWAAPLELFCEIAMEIRDQSPFPFTFYYGYCNGFLGYFPTKTAFAHGGYEPSPASSPYTPQGEADLTSAVVTYLQGKPR
jgi:neutral ceramidase